MSSLGTLICRVRDSDGEIHVYQDAHSRYLTFGNRVEQSCLDLCDPQRLVHVYTQAMMLSLLLCPSPRRVLLLGLGGGSLAKAVRAAAPAAHICGVEQRAAVIEVARQHFHLPEDRRFQTLCQDASTYLSAHDGSHELILSDLYLADGMDVTQTNQAFVQLAHDRLTENGVLVINQWASEFSTNQMATAVLGEVFDGRVLHLHVQGGNIVSFALRGALPDLQRKLLFAAAQALGSRLSIPLQRHARNLWRQNAEVLGIGRFTRRGIL